MSLHFVPIVGLKIVGMKFVKMCKFYCVFVQNDSTFDKTVLFICIPRLTFIARLLYRLEFTYHQTRKALSQESITHLAFQCNQLLKLHFLLASKYKNVVFRSWSPSTLSKVYLNYVPLLVSWQCR